MPQDNSLAGRITNKAIKGLKWATAIGAVGAYVYFTGEHIIKERTAPDCPESLTSGFATAAMDKPASHALITLHDGSLCQIEFKAPSLEPST